MKKLFLLIPALVLSLAINAKEINITPTSPHSSGNNLLATLADAGTEDGDVIILADGTYNESSNYISFDKSVEVRAAEGAHPVVEVETYIKIGENAANKNITIRGIKFDAEKQGPTGTTANTYSHFIRVYSAGTLDFEDCEFCNTQANKVIKVEADKHLNYLKINNCYFHDGNNSAIHVYQATDAHACDRIEITNSTFANYSGFSDGLVEVFTKGGALAGDPADDAEFTMDHCTFYNYIKTADNTYGFVDVRKSTKTTISNCIFMNPTIPDGSYNAYATYTYGGSVTNCIYNGTRGNRMSPTGSSDADPLFIDAANGDYSLAGNYETMSISPARNAGTDGSHLGDPRWHSAEVLPSTDFATPYAFVGAKAIVSDKMQLNGDNYIASTASGGSAYWKINITKACAVQVTLNMSDAVVTGHNYQVEIFDAENNSIGALNEGGWRNNTDDKTLTGNIQIPSAGNYKIVLTNNESGTTSVIKGITLTYIGGATINIPAEELVGEEAVLVDEGHLRVYKLANGNLQYDDNSTPLGEYVYWNINATKAGDMKVTLNVAAPEVGDASSHQFLVELYSDLNASPIASSAEASATSGTGARVLPDAINIPAAGNYIVKLTNQTQWSSAILHSIQFEYLGGATITIPENALIGEEAVLVDEGHKKVYKDADGYLQYDDNSTPLGEYVYWNINATKAGDMKVTLNIVAPASGHQFLVELYSDLSGAPIASTAEPASTSATGAIVLPDINIPATGNYIIKLTNQTQWSSAILHSIEIKYAGGAVVNVPGQILGEDALLYKTGSKYMIRTEEGYLKSSNNGDPTSEWAVWNIAATAGTMNVTLNLDPVTSSGHNYRVELYDGDVLKDYAEELASTELSDAVHSKGDVALEKKLVIPTDGNYTIKLINRTQWSSMILQGITFTPAAVATLVTMNDTDEDNTAWVGNVGGAAVNVELSRSFVGGMYNTISLPFAVSSEKVIAAFGAGVELMYMAGATLDGTVLDLEFAPTTSIHQGTPYLIKPAANVVNPQFTDVKFELSDATTAATGGTNADFIGTFVKTTIPGNPNNLYLQSGNVLMFSENDVTIKGTRAYFHVDVPSSALPVVRPRIVMNGQVLTDVELVNGEPQVNGKFIENGQLVIIRDGVRYNALGVRVK